MLQFIYRTWKLREYNNDSRDLHCFPCITTVNTKLTVCMIHEDAQTFYPAVLD
jgi:hypothetical protein